MHIVGHDHPRMQGVVAAGTVLNRGADKDSDLRLLEVSGSAPRVVEQTIHSKKSPHGR